jgi:fatty-acyl-CoA synthase
MAISHHAATNPDRVATIRARTGESLTYGELNDRSIRLARMLQDSGLRPGDVVALFMDNNIRFHEVVWAALRSGMYVCPINRHLTAEEAAYIVTDSEAKALITSTALEAVALKLAPLVKCPIMLSVDGAIDGYERYEAAIATVDASPLPSEPAGDGMYYSSGTTGRPKGIKRALVGGDFTDPAGLEILLGPVFGFGTDTTYLSPAPLYHAAPFGFTRTIHTMGGTNIIMDRFDALEALRLIEEHQVTHSQWVPTMFIRMLKLAEEDRSRYDLSSHRVAVHAAAPCPVDVKHKMIDWWGPMIWEYYGGSELNGLTLCDSDQWLAHPGTVGKPILGSLHICDENGTELEPHQPGAVYFERDRLPFNYHNDPEKTRSAQHPEHPTWTKLGDVGYVDEDGYLHLTDRESFMIISGGVNIYPQEIEDSLALHPRIRDVAVIGVPNADLGEEVKAVVELEPGFEPSEEIALEILAYARERLANYKVPRSVDFEAQLPRLETGKLYKRLLRDRYWGNHESRIV